MRDFKSFVLIPLMLLSVATFGEGQPMPPRSAAPVIPNASLVTAKVLKYSIWSTTLWQSRSLQILYSLVLEVTASENVADEVNLVRVGDRIEAFSKEVLSADLLGKTVRATIRSHGDEWGQRFWIQAIHLVNN